MDYTELPYDYNTVEDLKAKILRGVKYGYHSWFGTPALRDEFLELFHGLLESHNARNPAQFEAIRAITILRWRARWLDLVEMQWMTAEGLRFRGYPKTEIERATPNHTIFTKLTRDAYPWLWHRIRKTNNDVLKANRHLQHLQKKTDAWDALARRQACFAEYQPRVQAIRTDEIGTDPIC